MRKSEKFLYRKLKIIGEYQVIIPPRDEWRINQRESLNVSFFLEQITVKLIFQRLRLFHYCKRRSSLKISRIYEMKSLMMHRRLLLLFNKQLTRTWKKRLLHLMKLILRCDAALLLYKLFLFNNRFKSRFVLHNNEDILSWTFWIAK